MSKRPAAAASQAGAAGASPNIKLPTATPLWLHAGAEDKYLLLQDPETGDVLMPLIYMKPILEANYSRKLAALKHRQVSLPPASPLADKAGLLYWQWAFEAPLCIKTLVRRELGEDNTPQGHLRLVLVPIVYNALAIREEMHSLPLFKALHGAMRRSSYWPLLMPPPPAVVEELDAELAVQQAAQQGVEGGAEPPPPLFAGPTTLEGTARKYMFAFKDASEVEQSKKARTTGAAVQQEGVAIVEAAVRRAAKRGDQPDASGTLGAAAGSAGGDTTAEATSQPAGAGDSPWGSGQAAAGPAAPGTGQQPRQQRQASQRLSRGNTQSPPSQREGGAGALAPRGSGGSGSGAGIKDSGPDVRASQQLGGAGTGQQGSGERHTGGRVGGTAARQGTPEGGGSAGQAALLQQIRLVVQEELRPVQQRLEALAEEVASLRRNVQRQQPAVQPHQALAGGGLKSGLPSAGPSSAWTVPQPQKPAAEVEELLAGDPELRALLQQQLGLPWPADKAQGKARKRGASGELQQQQQQPAGRGFQAVGGSGGSLTSSPLASLNLLMDQLGSRALTSSMGPPAPPPSSGAGAADLLFGGAGSGGGGGGGRSLSSLLWAGTKEDRPLPVKPSGMGGGHGSGGSVDALAAAADALAQAAAAGTPGGSGRGGGGEPKSAPQNLLMPDGSLDWSKLLSLGTSGLDAALQALSAGSKQQRGTPRGGDGAGGQQRQLATPRHAQQQQQSAQLDEVLAQLTRLQKQGPYK